MPHVHHSTAETLACLSMHQPWASLLIYGIKRIEGRSWNSNFRGRLWIHATAKEPDAATIEELEEFYRTVHAMDGNTPVFPEAYPTGVLLGSVEVVDVLPAEDLAPPCWPGLPDSLRLEVGSEQCFLCQAPLRLVVLQQMKGSPKIWALPKKVAKAAAQALRPPPALIPFSWSNLPPRLHEDSTAVKEGLPSQPPARQQQEQSRQSADTGSSPGQRGTANSHPDSSSFQLPTTAEEAVKQLRAARKKLRQIEDLQLRLASGGQLDTDQAAKVARAPTLIQQIADLEAAAAALAV